MMIALGLTQVSTNCKWSTAVRHPRALLLWTLRATMSVFHTFELQPYCPLLDVLDAIRYLLIAKYLDTSTS